MLQDGIRSLATLAMGIWLGGIVIIALVAANTFRTMRELDDVSQPNAVAGKVMAGNFVQFDRVQVICAVMLLVCQVTLLVIERPGWRDWSRLGLIIAACGLLAYSTFVMTPRMLDLQGAAVGADPDAAAKVAFDQFHVTAVRISKALLLLLCVIAVDLALPSRMGNKAGHSLAKTPVHEGR